MVSRLDLVFTRFLKCKWQKKKNTSDREIKTPTGRLERNVQRVEKNNKLLSPFLTLLSDLFEKEKTWSVSAFDMAW